MRWLERRSASVGRGFEGEREGDVVRPMWCVIGRGRVHSDLKKS